MAATKKKDSKQKPKTNPKSSATKNKSVKTSGKANPKKGAGANASAPKYVLSEKEIKIRSEIKLLVALAVTVLAELSCFGMLSPLGDYVGYFIFGVFGVLGYVMPVILFFMIAFMLSNRNNRTALIKTAAGAVLIMIASAIIQLIFIGYGSEYGARYYYEKCGEEKIGGGFIGSLISNALCSAVGMMGAFVILVIIAIICLVLITERSFIGGVKRSGKKIYTSAANDVERIKENVEIRNKEKKYQKQSKRMDKKVKGVNLSRIVSPLGDEEGIHEITGQMHASTSVYKGRVDIDEGITAVKVESMYEPKTVAKEDRKFTQAPKSNMVSSNTSDRSAYSETMKPLAEELYEPPVNEEDGLFRPKEKIEVSENAKNVMKRGVYGMGAVAANRETVSANNSLKSQKSDDMQMSEDNKTAMPVQNEASKQTHMEKRWVLPKTNLLNRGEKGRADNEYELRQTADMLETILKNFGVSATVTEYHRGPSVTRYEIQPEIGTRLSKITALADDIKLNLAATDIRIEPIPGKPTIGIEVPNKKRESVFIRDLIESGNLINNRSKLAFAAGMDIAGDVIVGDIAKMPHMLVAGTTGSGKSVFTNSIIMSILYRATPDEVRLIIVDPKVVEFGVYNGIPHLLQPVVTDPRLASNTLKWATAEMSERYKKFAAMNVRDLKGYNERVEDAKEKMPQIVIVIDELADLMMVAAKEVEESICRLAQLARAAGIHLIIATQRPSVDVVTGLIKANIPSRVALMVSSGVDSRTIIDSNGAEKLLGNGDMLFYPSGYLKAVRLQGAFVSDEEVHRTVEFWKNQADGVTYDSKVIEYIESQPVASEDEKDDNNGKDEYFADASRFCIEKKKASVSMLQRMFKIGFNRASRIIEQMEAAGIVSSEDGTKPRKVLVTMEEFELMISDNGKEEE